MNAVMKMFEGQEKSLAQFDAYRRDYADAECGNQAKPVEELLMPWAINKAGLYQMFDEKLILTKEVSYNRDHEELAQQMETMLSQHRSFVQTFFARLAEELGVRPDSWRTNAYMDDSPNEFFYYSMRYLMNDHSLVEARVDSPMKATICGQQMNFAVGQKAMRAIGKVARALGLNEEFEAFRVAHSMVLNQAKLKGKLCLSIHPLDYATASDNESGWSSCMSWREGGAYRFGTVEMMTSSYVICAYLASDSVEMDIGEGKWPSKKWRAWVIVTPDFIVVNRNYPYDNEDLMRACVDWVKEMAGEYYHVKYGETHNNWNQNEFFEVDMNYMYNDLGDGHVGCYAEGADTGNCGYINISGPAICMWCGETVDYNSDDDAACTLTCQECSGRVRCACCGTTINHGYEMWGPDDEPYCECCYQDRFSTCDCCNDVVDSDTICTISIPVDHEWAKQWISAWDHDHPDGPHFYHYIPEEITARVCPICLKDAGIDPDKDLEWDPILPFQKRSRWGGLSAYWNGSVIHPRFKWNDVCELFGCEYDDEFYSAIWHRYAESVRSHRWNETLFI